MMVSNPNQLYELGRERTRDFLEEAEKTRRNHLAEMHSARWQRPPIWFGVLGLLAAIFRTVKRWEASTHFSSEFQATPISATNDGGRQVLASSQIGGVK